MALGVSKAAPMTIMARLFMVEKASLLLRLSWASAYIPETITVKEAK